MNTFVSGESDASGQGPHIAVGPAAVAIRRPEFLGTLGIWLGRAGEARRGMAGLEQGKEYGGARPGKARQGKARLGKARNKARHGKAGPGGARPGRARNLGWRNNQQTQNTHGTR